MVGGQLSVVSKEQQQVMVTAYGREEVMKQAEEASFENVLIKPVTPSMLFDSVVQALSTEERSESGTQVSTSTGFDFERIRGAQVLLVEDNELNREVAIGLLEDAPVSVRPAENGEVAIQMLRERKYDLVLMDMQMPVMDGLAATRLLRQDPKFSDLPIVAMTANAMAGDREKCLEAGMNDHLAKPIDPDKLFEALLRWIPPRPVSTPAAVASQKVQAVDSAPLEIPGIDTHTALKRTGGNRQRYESFLRRFADTQADAVPEIRAALDANDAATAQRTAHSLKGAASNLGADTLATAAASAEIAIKTQGNAEAALVELERSLAKTVGAIRQTLPAPSPEPVARSGNGNPSAVLQPLSQLRKLLEADDSEAADFIVESHASLSAALSGDEIESLTRLVSDFDYEGALRAVSVIADRLCLKLE